MTLSHLSHTLIGSEIVKLGNEIKERIRQGETIYNFTIGDFDPQLFPIPKELEEEIVTAYRQRFTNYPIAEGNPDLREAIQGYVKTFGNQEYALDEILVASGGRPLIYAIYRAICDAGEGVIYAVPSWNNNHYTHFVGGDHRLVEAPADNAFMPRAADIKPHLEGATLLALCSPQNPTGTTFSREGLREICEMVVEENARRSEGEKGLYLLFDQMYCQLTYGDTRHFDPVQLTPDVRPYTIYVDAISKAFAATGVRVGWTLGPAPILAKIKAILSHVGAWAPMAEQKAVARFLPQTNAIRQYLAHFKSEVEYRLRTIYDGLMELKAKGLPVDAVTPEAAIYLTIRIDGVGKSAGDKTLKTQADVTAYLLSKAGLAIVPFYAFGAPPDSPWYRLSVGTCKREEIGEMLERLEAALAEMK